MVFGKASLFRYFLLCFIVGIGLRSFFPVPWQWLSLLAAGAATLTLFSRLTIIFWYVAAGISFIVFGIVYYQFSDSPAAAGTVSSYYNQHVQLIGQVVEPPDTRIDHRKLTVRIQTINGANVFGKVLVGTELYPEYRYGDLVSVACRLRAPQPFNGFAYDRYLAKEGIYATCFDRDITLVAHQSGNAVLKNIYSLQQIIQRTINRSLPEPQASLLSAMLLGAQRGIPPTLQENLRLTGTSHLVAVSGLNVVLLTAIASSVAAAVLAPRKITFYLITFLLVGYVVLVGLPASAVRAALMIWLVLLAKHVGRVSHASHAVIVGAAVMLVLNPRLLRDDIGFQLSFAAVLGLLYFMPLFTQLLTRLPTFFGLRQILSATLAAQLATTPLIIYHFGYLSLISPLTNILVVPAIPYVMVGGIVALLLSMLTPSLAAYYFLAVYPVLTYVIEVLAMLASASVGSLTL